MACCNETVTMVLGKPLGPVVKSEGESVLYNTSVPPASFTKTLTLDINAPFLASCSSISTENVEERLATSNVELILLTVLRMAPLVTAASTCSTTLSLLQD